MLLDTEKAWGGWHFVQRRTNIFRSPRKFRMSCNIPYRRGNCEKWGYTKNWVWGSKGSSVAEGRQGWRQPLILGFAQVLIHCDLRGHKVPADSVRMLYFSYIFWPFFSYYICSRFYPVQFNKQLLSIAFGYWVPTTPKLSGLKQQHSSTCPQFCHLGKS